MTSVSVPDWPPRTASSGLQAARYYFWCQNCPNLKKKNSVKYIIVWAPSKRIRSLPHQRKRRFLCRHVHVFFYQFNIYLHMWKHRKLPFFFTATFLDVVKPFWYNFGGFIQQFFRFSPVNLLKICLIICFNIF